MNSHIPSALKKWFIAHFVIDILIAIPLFFAPVWFLGLLGWEQVDQVMVRIVAAAFFGIGIESLIGRNSGPEAFKGMLNLKIIWSAAATLGISYSYLQGSQGDDIWLILTAATFLCFNGIFYLDL